jgi:uncharacterized surface protein with fasciclin (FAS1) repeats
MKVAFVACVVLCALAAVQGRQLQQKTFPTVAAALEANKADLSTLAAAIKASGIAVPDGPVTIFAPTNKAFQSDDIKETTGLSATELLQPKNKAALVALLQYHIVPGVAARSTGLKNNQEIKTALTGAKPLTVKIEGKKVEIEGDGDKPTDKDSVDVVIADIAAGKAIIHVVDDVLIPAKLRKP